MEGYERPSWPAYPMTVFVAGLGHVYLGHWRRGAIWFLLYVLALVFLSARSISGAFDPSDPFVLEALQFEAVNFIDVAVPLTVMLVCLLDLYLFDFATSGPTAEPDEPLE
ncbi:MAG: hypothetical protein U5K37_10780 [Natrialbaceae archaeon]|nr:hypothetical protein [Natrialbaceae archaeon]